MTCVGTTPVGDLLELADRLPHLRPRARPAQVHRHARRTKALRNLIDVAWDRDVRLIVLAAGPRPQILDADLTARERTHSRLQRLQTA
jgi:predicted ATPase